ncbi:hypothetical protein DCE79_02870 [Lysinibacillus sp. 2017]|uniref:hypothetical protein n=1 Tax=unclassified Lysinibacillus TaxID=2636778 RepID=UPI000D52896C|nr:MULTISPECIES: hypothetical protein [unclassified Lysinibacillus]AWE06389.1 hypothetical protein DCE79_02870 [Lysinibacillus sp. 2017]TGN33395.1 hypothetical protein E4L99_14350 [Lysinibacillus sp. S2017]
MEQQLITDTKESYYLYASGIAQGCNQIANDLRTGQIENALNSIANLAEGIEWLLNVEQILAQHNLKIRSRIMEANEFLMEVNDALIQNDTITVADLFEYEIQPLFDSASEWAFQEQ